MSNNLDWQELAGAMSDISEDAFHAGWMSGLEYHLWHILRGGPREYGRISLTDEQVDRLQKLSDDLGGWVRFSDESGEEFVERDRWRDLYDAWRESLYSGPMQANPPPASASPLRRSLVTSLLVGTVVSLGHYLAPGAAWWPIIHFLLPITVFSLSAWRAGHRTVTSRLVLRGVVTVVIVGIAFTAINTLWTLAPVVRVALNYLVPFLVSLAGSAGGRGRGAELST